MAPQQVAAIAASAEAAKNAKPESASLQSSMLESDNEPGFGQSGARAQLNQSSEAPTVVATRGRRSEKSPSGQNASLSANCISDGEAGSSLRAADTAALESIGTPPAEVQSAASVLGPSTPIGGKDVTLLASMHVNEQSQQPITQPIPQQTISDSSMDEKAFPESAPPSIKLDTTSNQFLVGAVQASDDGLLSEKAIELEDSAMIDLRMPYSLSDDGARRIYAAGSKEALAHHMRLQTRMKMNEAEWDIANRGTLCSLCLRNLPADPFTQLLYLRANSNSSRLSLRRPLERPPKGKHRPPSFSGRRSVKQCVPELGRKL